MINFNTDLFQQQDKIYLIIFIIYNIKSIKFPYYSYAVCGGAMMVVRGFKPSTHDIDLLVSHEFFESIKACDDRFQEPTSRLASAPNHCLVYEDVELLDVAGFTNIPDINNYLER